MSRKRKHHVPAGPYAREPQETYHIFSSVLQPSTSTSTSQPDPSLYVRAYEADLVIGAEPTAFSLETTGGIGDALIRWNATGAAGEVFVDRYDVRLLLDALPLPQPSLASPAGSAWSDLPSDAEDTFFFDPEEVEDYHRDKRRRELDQIREARVSALREQRGDDEFPVQEEPWGESDEEVDGAQKELMRRTASNILSSPNPAALQARILANHGADKRFAFLRGRWSRTWRVAQAKARAEEQEEAKDASKPAGLGGLADYASDSDAESDYPPQPPTAESLEVPAQLADVDAVKEGRRMRAREWSQNRRAKVANNSKKD